MIGTDKTCKLPQEKKVIYLAGGCFWGMDKLMSALPGVVETTTGYANGKDESMANYKRVCEGDTEFRETVRVIYDPERISLETILMAYFHVIDATVYNQQGEDKGAQYQTGIYYADEDAEAIVKDYAKKEAEKYESFAVEIKPLVNFFDAEEYHQDYLKKNPDGYCHIANCEIEEVLELVKQK